MTIQKQLSKCENLQFERINLLDIGFHKITVNALISYIIQQAQLDKKTVISNVNIRAMNFAHSRPSYRNFINNSDLVFCDGFGVLLGAKLHGYQVQKKHRMTCPDYIESLAKACDASDVSIFLLAGCPGVVDKAIAKLKTVAPNLRIAGHHGFFEKTGAENDTIIQLINDFEPEILYVGFGMPLQEEWIQNNLERINANVFLPLGACLDFYTHTVYRGPKWMTNRGLEWLSRLLVQPHRLWRRYLFGNPFFFYRVIKAYLFNKLK